MYNYTDEQRLKVWEMWGKYFGFPSCCIEAFLKGEHKKGGYFCGTGFVPCEKCYDKPVEEVMNVIKVNRICPTPFENYGRKGYSDEEKEFIVKFWKSFLK